MNLTTHYGLNMPETRDTVDITKLNENMVKVDALICNHLVLTGAYTGTGTPTRTIALDFTPRALLVMTMDGKTFTYLPGTPYYHGGLCLEHFPCLHSNTNPIVTIVQNGFEVYSASYVYSNAANAVFHYLAWK